MLKFQATKAKKNYKRPFAYIQLSDSFLRASRDQGIAKQTKLTYIKALPVSHVSSAGLITSLICVDHKIQWSNSSLFLLFLPSLSHPLLLLSFGILKRWF